MAEGTSAFPKNVGLIQIVVSTFEESVILAIKVYL